MQTSIPQGYKQTEIGVIPKDWEVAQLGQLCVFENGDRGKNYPLPTSFTRSGIPFVNAGHVAGGRIKRQELDYITRESYDRLSSGKIKQGDILFCLRGSLGKFGIVEHDFGEGAIASSLVIVRPRTAKFRADYLGHYFNSQICTQMIEKWSGGAAQPNLGAQDLSRFEIPYPLEPSEQTAIAEALSDADALIESLEQLIAKKRAVKQGAMQELLTGKRRLPGFEGEWEVRKIGDLLTIIHGKSQHAVVDKNGVYPILATGGQIGTANRFLYDKPSVLIGRKGTIDQPQFMDKPFWTVDTLFYSEIHTPNEPKFLYYRFCLIDWKQHNEASGVPSLNARTIEKIEVSVPSSNEQTAIAAVLSDMDAEIAALETKLTKTRQVKQGMMQELLTGRTRLV